MIESRYGELAALITAVCWTVTAMAFESAGKRVGALAVNLLRLFLGFIFLLLYSLIFRGVWLPLDATAHTWFWLGLSGLIGLVLGDLFLFHAFTIIGSRIAMLIMAAVPPLTAVIGWLVMGEQLGLRGLSGMFLTVAGIVMVILHRNPHKKKVAFSHSLTGILFAFGGALGQALGLVLSKYGMGTYDPFAATQIRIIAGMAGFSILFFFLRAWGRAAAALHNRHAMLNITLGSVFGPFLGVSFSLLAVQYTTTGVASTIIAIVPILIIPPAVLIFRERVTGREVLGAVIAVAGVALLFL
jgi:drug/metabolite transporter (DMT)-like permease